MSSTAAVGVLTTREAASDSPTILVMARFQLRDCSLCVGFMSGLVGPYPCFGALLLWPLVL